MILSTVVHASVGIRRPSKQNFRDETIFVIEKKNSRISNIWNRDRI